MDNHSGVDPEVYGVHKSFLHRADAEAVDRSDDLDRSDDQLESAGAHGACLGARKASSVNDGSSTF